MHLTMYIHSWVTKDQTGWDFTVKQGGRTVLPTMIMASSLTLEMEAVTA